MSAQFVETTELTESGEDKAPLPPRFMHAVRACRGEYTPDDPAADTQESDDLLTGALLTFPCEVRLKLVSEPLGDEAAARLVSDVRRLVDETQPGSAPLSVTSRGKRTSIALVLADVPDVGALAAVRDALAEDPRVWTIF